MKDKLPLLFPHTQSISISQIPEFSEKIRDAMNALINLGYTQSKAEIAVKKTLNSSSEEIDLPTLITKSLSHASK